MERRTSLPRPTLILFCGIACSGKTTVLSEVARRVVDTFWIDKDTLNKSFMHNRFGELIPGGITSDYYHEYVKNQSYYHMLNEALINIRLGKHPMLDGNYNKQIRSGYFDDVVFPLFAQEDCVTKIVYCYAPEEVILDRMITRDNPRDREKWRSRESWAEFLAQQPILPSELEKYDHVKIDTSQPMDKCVEETIQYLTQITDISSGRGK